jgi:hypothetical protein
MTDATVPKKDATDQQRLRYLEQINQTLMGLQSANQALLARRAFAGAEESRGIDISVSENNSEWAKAAAAQALYFTDENATFNPPTQEEVEEMKKLVRKLDGIIAAEARASNIMKTATKVVGLFRDTQPT